MGISQGKYFPTWNITYQFCEYNEKGNKECGNAFLIEDWSNCIFYESEQYSSNFKTMQYYPISSRTLLTGTKGLEEWWITSFPKKHLWSGKNISKLLSFILNQQANSFNLLDHSILY